MLTAIPTTVREHIGTTLLHWLRDPNITHDMVEWTPRNIRDRILSMIPVDETSPMERARIANQLARWIQDEDGYVAVRFQRDVTALNSILRIIDAAVEVKGAEKDEDLVDDETAWSYGRAFDWVNNVAADMRGLLREQKRLRTRPKKAYEILVQHAHGSLLDALAV